MVCLVITLIFASIILKTWLDTPYYTSVIVQLIKFRYKGNKKLHTNAHTTFNQRITTARNLMASSTVDQLERGAKRQLHHYENLLTLASVRLEHSGLYSCVPSSGLPNVTVNLHVVKGM